MTYLKLCVQSAAAFWICGNPDKKKTEWKTAVFYKSVFSWMNKDPWFKLHSSLKRLFVGYGAHFAEKSHGRLRKNSLCLVLFSFSWKDLWSERMIKRRWPVCLTSIHLLCYFNNSNTYWHVAPPPQTIIREPCQEVKCPLWVATKDAEKRPRRRDKERKLTQHRANRNWFLTKRILRHGGQNAILRVGLCQQNKMRLICSHRVHDPEIKSYSF